MKISEFTITKSHVDGITVVNANSNQALAKHWHDEFGIGVIDAGAQSSLSGSGLVEAVCGNMIAVNPGEVHDGKPLGCNGRQWRMLYFKPQLILSLVEDIAQATTSSFEISAPIIDNRLMTNTFNLLYTLLNKPVNNAASEEILLNLVADLMMLEKTANNTTLTTKSVPDEIIQAISFMNDEPTRDMQLSDLATVTGLSKFQVLRGVSKATGLTPHAYLIQKRVDLAKSLIIQGKDLCDAAGLAGFSDQSHMHRIFVKKYGITPGKYALCLK